MPRHLRVPGASPSGVFSSSGTHSAAAKAVLRPSSGRRNDLLLGTVQVPTAPPQERSSHAAIGDLQTPSCTYEVIVTHRIYTLVLTTGTRSSPRTTTTTTPPPPSPPPRRPFRRPTLQAPVRPSTRN
ncbi:hypothetical protein E2C01_080095 [Portunus trituberculatus]|uniref:Uncharacterized protein n=1 Tax=Portunus trituberculatus TaxID=210409 RepID=A0A5B7IUI5_PORTR|nr:hypothetical protein [Portunus trituberculatus]